MASTNFSNGIEFQLKEWGLGEAKTVGPTATNHGWSIMVTARDDSRDELLGGEQFLSIDLKPGTPEKVADQLVTLLNEHCKEIGHTKF